MSDIDPKKLQEAVEQGHRRLKNFRKARMMFLRQFVGHYYDRDHGTIGDEPINLIYNAMRVLIPNLVFNFPKHTVYSEYLTHREYGRMLEKALGMQDRELDIKNVYRRAIVDAFFTMGIMKTGICESGEAGYYDEDDMIDPGMVYTEVVDFDNFVFDPHTRSLSEAMFVGDRIRVSRDNLLESGLYNNELVERLPSVDDGDKPDEKRVDELSSRSVNYDSFSAIDDIVEVYELWIPRSNTVVTVPGSIGGFRPDDYLRVDDYYGPKEGPYTYLTLGPPVPNNPLPVAPVGIWYDLHVKANKMMNKIMDQAERQKDITFYARAAADDAQEALDATDGDAIAVDDPSSIDVKSYGGQQGSNEAHMASLSNWFNMMSGNSEALGGQSMGAESATEAQILASAGQVTLEDMKAQVYEAARQESQKRAWYLHTDPLIELPMTQRVHTPAQYGQGPAGPVMVQPPREEEVQVVLTPEARRGDFLDFTFDITPESMGRQDSESRKRRAMEFAVKVLPSVAQAGAMALQMGVPFSYQRFITRLAEEAGIPWMDEVFQDPDMQMEIMRLQMAGPDIQSSKGQLAGGGSSSGAGVAQNGQSPRAGKTQTQTEQRRSDAQQGANDSQAAMSIREL